MIKKSSFLFLAIALALGFALLPVNIKADPSTASLKVSVQRTYAFRLGDTTIVTKTLAGQDASSSPWVKKLYNTCRTLLDIVAFALLIFIAFMNILQKDIETYAIKKMLPPAIYALILGNLGLPIFALASRVVDALMGIKMFSPINLTQIYQIIIGGEMGYGSIVFMVIAVVAALSFWNCFGFCFFFLIMGVPLFGVIILNTLLSIRPIIIYLMAAVSPIAFAANILPGTQQYFKKWLGIIFPWLIFPPLVAFFFYIARLMPANTAVNVPLTWGLVPVILSIAMPILLKAGILYLAIRLPFMLEKDIAALAATAGKAAANWGWGAGRNVMGLAYRKFDDAEKTAVGKSMEVKEHYDAGVAHADRTIKRENYQAGAEGDREYESARTSAIRAGAAKDAKEKFRKQHKVALTALEYNPFNAIDAYKESKEMRTNRGKTGAKKFSKFDQIVGGREYMMKYKQEAAKDDLRSEQSAQAAMNYNTGSYETIFSAVRDRMGQEARDFQGADLDELRTYNAPMADFIDAQNRNDEQGMQKASRASALRQLRTMNIGGAGATAYQAAFGLGDKDAGEMVEINNKFWQNISRRFTKPDSEIFGNAEAMAGALPALTSAQRAAAKRGNGEENPVGDIGAISDVEIESAESTAQVVALSNGISEALDNLGATVAEDLPTGIAQAVGALDVKASLPEVRATVDKFSMDAMKEIQSSGMEQQDAQLLIDGASMGNLGFVDNAIKANQAHGTDPNTNPFFLAIRRAAAAGYLQRSTENNIIQEIAKSDDTNTTLMLAQKLAPAVSAQGGEELVGRHLKTLVDVNAGVQVEPKIKEDMERYFSNLNLGVKVGGEFSLDPLKVRSALTALKSPEFSVDPKIAIGKATLSNGYAENLRASIEAGIKNNIPDEALAFDQVVNIRLNETLRAEANVRGVELSKASMDSIEKAKTQIKDQIVAGTSAPIAVAQAFDVLVQGQPNIVRQTQQSGQPQPAAQAPNNTI